MRLLSIDITERKHLQDQVIKAAQEWINTFNTVQDLIMILNRDFRIVRTNRAVKSFFQYPPQQIIGSYCYDLKYGRRR